MGRDPEHLNVESMLMERRPHLKAALHIHAKKIPGMPGRKLSSSIITKGIIFVISKMIVSLNDHTDLLYSNCF